MRWALAPVAAPTWRAAEGFEGLLGFIGCRVYLKGSESGYWYEFTDFSSRILSNLRWVNGILVGPSRGRQGRALWWSLHRV